MTYNEVVKSITPKEKRLENAIRAFVSGGIIGSISELLVSAVSPEFMLIVWIAIAAFLTGFGRFDDVVDFLKMGAIIPITGFAHSVAASSLEYKEEGLITGIGANYLKLAGSVILYGVLTAAIFAGIRGVLWLL